MTPPTQPLELRDIHLPDPISWWPPAPGWWWVLGLLGGMVLLGGLLWRRARRNRLRKTALAELDRLVAAYATHQDDHRLTGELSALLRRVCLAPLWPAAATVQEVAGLTGVAWLHFLDQTLPDQPFTQGPGRWLVSLPFQRLSPALPEEERTALIALCRVWLQIYTVPKRRASLKGVRGGLSPPVGSRGNAPGGAGGEAPKTASPLPIPPG
ncbi:MAG: DUF4381 domain-containing protein [Magnetococcales bacterium]|nr:DUF4381 domain-containing protein [Magnetococcales bacterium]